MFACTRVGEGEWHVTAGGSHIGFDLLALHVVAKPPLIKISQTAPSFDHVIHVVEHGQAHGGVHFTQFQICTYIDDGASMRIHAEIDHAASALAGIVVAEHHRATFDRVEHLRRMEADCRGITPIKNALPAFAHTKTVCGVINHFQPMPSGNLANARVICRVSVDMHRSDRRRIWPNG